MEVNLTLKNRLENIESLLRAQSLNNKIVFNLDELVLYTNLSKLYVYKLTSQNKIPFYRPNGKQLFFKKVEIDNWLLRNRQSTIEEIEIDAANYSVNKLGNTI
tara:strand:+ start:342 stop:650 length:309 start_codon:yes stop_codon:yes gene_type:complete